MVKRLIKRVVKLENELEKFKHPKKNNKSSVIPSNMEKQTKRKL